MDVVDMDVVEMDVVDMDVVDMIPYHHQIYVTHLLVRSVHILCINVVLAAKKVARKAKNC